MFTKAGACEELLRERANPPTQLPRNHHATIAPADDLLKPKSAEKMPIPIYNNEKCIYKPDIRTDVEASHDDDSKPKAGGSGPMPGPIQVPFAPAEAEKMPVPIYNNKVFKCDTRTDDTGGQDVDSKPNTRLTRPMPRPTCVPFSPAEFEKMPIPINNKEEYKRDTRTDGTGGQGRQAPPPISWRPLEVC